MHSQRRHKFQKRAIAAHALRAPKPSIKSLDKRIKKINARQELKWKDLTQSAVAIPSTGVFTLLNGLTKGTDADDATVRVGNEVTATSVQFRAKISCDDQQLNGSTVRHIIFWDSQANGAAPVMADLLDNSVITVAVIAPYNRNNQKRFKIVYDRVYEINPNIAMRWNITAGTPDVALIDQVVPTAVYEQKKISLHRTVKYNDANVGDVTDILTNSLYSLYVSDFATNDPVINTGFRFYFKDD